MLVRRSSRPGPGIPGCPLQFGTFIININVVIFLLVHPDSRDQFRKVSVCAVTDVLPVLFFHEPHTGQDHNFWRGENFYLLTFYQDVWLGRRTLLITS